MPARTRRLRPNEAAIAITNAVEMTKHSGMTDCEAYQHVANTLFETITAILVERARKELWKCAGPFLCN